MKNKIFFILLALSLTIGTLCSILIGPVDLGILDIFSILINNLGIGITLIDQSYTHIQETVLMGIRLPRIILGLLVGISLGTAGAILQGLFRNPLVDPGFIGVSSGAAIGAMFVIMFSNLLSDIISPQVIPYLLPIFAMFGAIITTYIVYKISKKSNRTNVMTMLLTGIAINALVGSLIGLLIINSNDIQLRTFTFWTLGSLDNANWEVVTISSFFIILPVLVVYKYRTKLDIFMLGDAEATNLGIKVENLKKNIILVAALMVGVAVSFCGMIGFVGLVTPHLVRLIIGPSHNNLIPGSALLGALLLILSDLIARSILPPAQLPLSIITSLIGAPFFIWLIIDQKRKLKIA